MHAYKIKHVWIIRFNNAIIHHTRGFTLNNNIMFELFIQLHYIAISFFYCNQIFQYFTLMHETRKNLYRVEPS